MSDINNQFTVENIEQTLLHFYNDAESQAQANQFLILAQSSNQAWDFAWEFLQFSKPPEVQFFGASTLQAKISKNWNELPPDLYAPLRDRLMNALFTYTCGPRVVLTRLCICMSSFIIKTITDFWPSAISDIVKGFQPHNIPNASPQQVALVLLELLTVLIEEFQTVHLAHGKTGIVRHTLESSLSIVMNIVEDILSKTTAPAELCEMALKCYASWALLGSSIYDYKNLLILTFDSVYREEISQTALEALANIANHPESSKHPATILEIIENFTKFDVLLEKSSQDHNVEKIMLIYSLIICVAETHCQLLLETILDKPEKKDFILKLISIILKCSSTPGQYPVDEVCSELAFGFWYALQDSIVSTSRGFESLLLVFYPFFQTLLDSYLIKLRYPADDVYRRWKLDERESFRCYRQDIGDSVMYCYNVLKHSALANLMAHLELATTAAINDPTQWQYLEACLFAFKEIAESVDIKENSYLPAFMAHLRNIPLQHVRVISGAMEAIGSFAEWINCHPDVLGCVIPLLLMGLQNSEFAISATFALKDISRDCYTSMHPFAEQILHASLEALKGDVLKPREKIRIMFTIGKVLSVMPYSYILQYFDPLLEPVFIELDQHLRGKVMKVLRQVAAVNLFNMLSMLFSALDTHWEKDPDESITPELLQIRENNLKLPQPSHYVLEKLLEVMKEHRDTFEVTDEIAEALCDALKRAITLLSTDSKMFLPEILLLMVAAYKKLPHAHILDITKQVMILFSEDVEQRQIINEYFSQISEHTIQLSMKDFRESTTVIESYLQLLDNVIRKAFIFFKSETVNPLVLFQFGVAALSLPEKPTVKAAAGFLANFISHSREVPSMLNVVNSDGEMLVLQTLKLIGGEGPRYNVELMPDILMAFNKKYFDNLCRWMGHLIQQAGFPSARVNQRQKEEFVRMVLKERTNKRKLKETVNEFSLLCRGLIGTEYGAQSCLSFS
ncbi:importin-13 [Parasteatoda tepidariorum]|nr:importin-13 [Parasteatoda tepidariorum]